MVAARKATMVAIKQCMKNITTQQFRKAALEALLKSLVQREVIRRNRIKSFSKAFLEFLFWMNQSMYPVFGFIPSWKDAFDS